MARIVALVAETEVVCEVENLVTLQTQFLVRVRLFDEISGCTFSDGLIIVND
jgi:hypothetical protein